MMQTSVVLFAVLSGCGPLGLFGGEEAPTEFEVVDLDRNDKINQAEFAGWSGDQDLLQQLGGGEESIAPLDLANTLFTFWNTEGAGLTEAEWNAGLAQWFPDADPGTFQEWDLDGDGAIDEQEMQAGFAHTGVASAWDRDGDGEISGRELYNGMFMAFDEDGDRSLSDQEWTAGLEIMNY